MTRHSEDPMVPWRDRRPGHTDPEDRAAEILRGALVPGQPDGLQLARIERSLRAREGRPGHSSLASRLAFAGVFLVAGVATAKAYELVKTAGWFVWSRPAKAPSVAPAPAPAPLARRFVRPVPPVDAIAKDPVAPAAPADAPAAAPLAVVDHARPQPRATRRIAAFDPARTAAFPPFADRRAFEPAGIPTTRETNVFETPPVNPPPAAPEVKPPAPAPASTTGPAEEVRTLDEAIGLLRRQHDPAAALPILDSYLRRYPRGILNQEARLARVDALLMLARAQEALVALEALPLDTGRRSAELQVVRGELRARLDCAHAEEDFTAALTHSPDAGLLERILYGRGVCRAKLGNRSGSVEDLRRYLERFPRGAYAGPVRRWLDTISKSHEIGG